MKHPATYTNSFIPVFAEILNSYQCRSVLDPMAGTGKIALIKQCGFTGKIYCNDLETEWINSVYPVDYWSSRDAAEMPHFIDGMFDAICTSPTYANRLADHYNPQDGSKRINYTVNLGRLPSPGSTCVLQWGLGYREKHLAIYKECYRVLKPGGIFILNISNHIRKGKEMHVAEWTRRILTLTLGFRLLETRKMKTSRLRYGANAKSRVDFEYIFVFQKPS